MSVSENIAALNEAATRIEPVRAAVAQADDQLDDVMRMVTHALGMVPSYQQAVEVYQMTKPHLEHAQESLSLFQSKLQEIAAMLQASGS